MPGYALNCTACGNCFETRKDWLTHLLQDEHQRFSRRLVTQWSDADKKQALVIFASFPVACFEALEFFSKGMDIVTDFIALPDKPNTGILQFESSEKATEIVGKFKGPGLRINNQPGNLWKATDYQNLEWKQLLQVFEEKQSEPDKVLNLKIAVTKQAKAEQLMTVRKTHCEKIPNLMETYTGLCSQITISSKNQAKAEQLMTVRKTHCEKIPNRMETYTGLCSQITISSKTQAKAEQLMTVRKAPCENIPNLMETYTDLCSQITISAKTQASVVSIVLELKKIFGPEYPSCKIFSFRYWYLKLGREDEDELLLMIDFIGVLLGCKNMKNKEIKYGSKDINRIFNRRVTTKLMPFMLIKEEGLEANRMEPLGKLYEYNNIRFRISAHPNLKPEVQTCRLLKYLCSFDSRVLPLLTMIHFWGKVNGINFSTRNPELRKHPLCCTEPASMHWLMIIVLGKHKVIPTPGEILKRTGKHFKVYFQGTDISFLEDEDHVSHWKTRVPQPPPTSSPLFLWSVLKLAELFFSSIEALKFDSWILNTRDGEIFRRSQILSESGKLAYFTKLSQQEIRLINRKDYYKFLGKKNAKHSEMTVLLHPFFQVQKFLFCPESFVNEVCPSVEIVARRIRELLQSLRNGCCPNNINLELLFRTQ